MDDIYREHILDHYKNPRNFGDLTNATVKMKERLVSCGDVVQIALRLTKNKGQSVIEDVKFQGEGCALSIAAASLLTEYLKGKRVGDLERLDEGYMLKLMGVEVTEGRMDCVLLPLRALERAMKEVDRR